MSGPSYKTPRVECATCPCLRKARRGSKWRYWCQSRSNATIKAIQPSDFLGVTVHCRVEYYHPKTDYTREDFPGDNDKNGAERAQGYNAASQAQIQNNKDALVEIAALGK